jgi:nicotinamide mononucleotide transporter
VIDALDTAVAAMSAWEIAAVLLGITYLLLAMRENALCWYAAFASTAIYLVLFWQVDLVMESLLQVYYLGMAVYGWWHWRHGGAQDNALPISRWPPQRHLIVIGSVLVGSALVGFALSRFTDAALPYLDSFTTIGAVITTWMVAHKILENWLYWLVIDAASMWLYIDRGLFLTALLFAVYLVIVVFGFIEWRHHYRTQDN